MPYLCGYRCLSIHAAFGLSNKNIDLDLFICTSYMYVSISPHQGDILCAIVKFV